MPAAMEQPNDGEITDLERGVGEAEAAAAEEAYEYERQDSLFRDAHRPAHHHHRQDGWGRTLRLAFQCVGVLYGDIGTSPLYVYPSTFTKGIGHTDDLLGVLSLIIYSFVLFTVIKYVFIALHANDHGDGGIFALYSLISRHAKVSLIPNQQAEDALVASYDGDRSGQLAAAKLRRAQWMKRKLEGGNGVKVLLFLITILAGAMVISDAVLTPAISVLSAVSGLKEKAPYLTTDQIVWMTVGILVVLFGIQRFGTDKVGYSFAPIVLLWLLLIGGVGVYNLVTYDVGVLRAFNPKYIVDYFRRNGKKGWVSLGGILLCFTGTEALYSDLGYFSIRSVQLSFGFGLVPSVLLAYIGQAAFLRKHPEHVANTFYRSTPSALFWPTFVVAIAAAIIGSQAMISCAFATVSHAQHLGCFPRVKVRHTSRHYPGQVFSPEVNFLLCLATCVVTVAAKTTVVIGEAHGICVVLVMLITTVLLTIVMLLVWRTSMWWIALFFLLFASTESVYLSSVLYKFAHGGYIPVAMSAVLMALMAVWHYVHVKRYEYELEHTVPRDSIRALLERRDLRRVPGLGLFYTELVQGVPPVFPHLIDKIPSIHSVLLFVSVKHLPVPHVDAADRFLFRQVEPRDYKVFRCVARYGYRDTLADAKDFAAALVERLQYYIRDSALYAPDLLNAISEDSCMDAQSFARALPRSGSRAVYAEEMLTPSESFSEHAAAGAGSGRAVKALRVEEVARVEEEQRVIQEEMERGVVYILGESEVVAKPHSSLLKKLVVNHAYAFLRKNFRQGEKMLAIPRDQLLKVGILYEI